LWHKFVLLLKGNFSIQFHKLVIFAIMAQKSKNQKIVTTGVQSLITVDPSLPSFEGHPFFDKKAEAAKAVLKKAGMPKQFAHK